MERLGVVERQEHRVLQGLQEIMDSQDLLDLKET